MPRHSVVVRIAIVLTTILAMEFSLPEGIPLVSSSPPQGPSQGTELPSPRRVETPQGSSISLPPKEIRVDTLPFPKRSPVERYHHSRAVPTVQGDVVASSPSVGSQSSQPVQGSGSQTINASEGFSGLDQSYAFVTAADVQVAAGPQYVVEMVNSVGGVWTKQGTLVKVFNLLPFFTGSSYGYEPFDPRVYFDGLSGRWFASASGSGVKIAVSQTSNPLDNWWLYRFPDTYMPDQPLIGINDDKFVISVNDFSCDSYGRCGFVGAKYWVARKADLLAGASVNYVTFGPNGDLASVHPAISLSSSNTLFMSSTYPSCCILWNVSGVPPGPVTINNWRLPVASYPYYSPNAPQNGNSLLIDTGDLRIQDSYWLNGKLWLAFNDGCTPQGDTQFRSCLRLIQGDTGSTIITQDFDLGSVGE